MKPETHRSIYIGLSGQDYQVGNFLSALDELVCLFKAERIENDSHIIDALEMYAKHMREE